MSDVPVRVLNQETARVLARVKAGEEITVTGRGSVVARILPATAGPLDDLVGAAAFDLVFMDIEGSEYFALQGAQRVLAGARVLIVEWIAHHLSHVAGVDAATFWRVLAPHFDVLQVPRDGTTYRGAAAIGAALERMAAAGESHENIVFSKESARA